MVRVDDTRTTLKAFEKARIVCNSITSQSGYAALKQHWQNTSLVWPNHTANELRFSGDHRVSAKAVAEGHADIAALDILSYTLMQAHDDFTNQLRILDYTAPTPALPFICAPQFDVSLIAHALQTGVETLTEQDRQTLGLHGIVDIAAELYHEVPTSQESIDAFTQ